MAFEAVFLLAIFSFVFIAVTVMAYRIAPEIPIPFGAITGVGVFMTICLINMETIGGYFFHRSGNGWVALIGYFIVSTLILFMGMVTGGVFGGIYGHYVYKLRQWYRGEKDIATKNKE